MTIGEVTTLLTCNDCGLPAQVPINIYILHGNRPDRRTWIGQLHDWMHENGWGMLNLGDWQTTEPRYGHFCPPCWTAREQKRLEEELACLAEVLA